MPEGRPARIRAARSPRWRPNGAPGGGVGRRRSLAVGCGGRSQAVVPQDLGGMAAPGRARKPAGWPRVAGAGPRLAGRREGCEGRGRSGAPRGEAWVERREPRGWMETSRGNPSGLTAPKLVRAFVTGRTARSPEGRLEGEGCRRAVDAESISAFGGEALETASRRMFCYVPPK